MALVIAVPELVLVRSPNSARLTGCAPSLFAWLYSLSQSFTGRGLGQGAEACSDVAYAAPHHPDPLPASGEREAYIARRGTLARNSCSWALPELGHACRAVAARVLAGRDQV